MQSKINRRLLLLAPIGLAGCGSLLGKEAYIPRSDWPLNPPPPSGAGRGRGVVMVRDFQAGPELGGRGLLTLEADGSLHRGYYNRWAVAPAQAVTVSLVSWLQASGAFAAVVSSGSALTETLIVEGTLNTLLADVKAGVARAALTLVVARPHGIGELPVTQKRLSASAPLGGRTAPRLVAAQRAVFADILGQAVQVITAAA